MFVKLMSFIINKLYIKDKPVSDAPTTIILVLLETLFELTYFLEINDKEKGASSWSCGSLYPSTTCLVDTLFYKSA